MLIAVDFMILPKILKENRLIIILLIFFLLISPFHVMAESYDLSGVWDCDDDGKYYIVQIGSDVYWYGELNAVNPKWSNVAIGTINGDTLSLTWADVPKGTVKQYGKLFLKISGSQSPDTAQVLTVLNKTGNFGGSRWTRTGTAISDESICTDPSMELNTDRPGKDYKGLELAEPNPCECMKVCFNESQCRAYTYVKPGVQGEKARCWLKNEIPVQVQNTDCISGARNISSSNSTGFQKECSFDNYVNYLKEHKNGVVTFKLTMNNKDLKKTQIFVGYLSYDEKSGILTGDTQGLLQDKYKDYVKTSPSTLSLETKALKGTLSPNVSLKEGAAAMVNTFTFGCNEGAWFIGKDENFNIEYTLELYNANIPLTSYHL